MAATATALTAACLVAVAAVSACSKDDNTAQARPRRTTTTERESTTTTLSPEEAEKQAVIAAHEAANQARADAASPPTPDPEFAALGETHTGLMLDQWKTTLVVLRTNGFAIRYPEGSQARSEVDSVTFQDVEGQEVAYLEVCSVEDAERFNVGTGTVLQGGVRTIQATEAMQKVDGVWKLAERRENNYWEGVAGCAAD